MLPTIARPSKWAQSKDICRRQALTPAVTLFSAKYIIPSSTFQQNTYSFHYLSIFFRIMFVTTSPVIGFLLLAASVLASASPLLARAASSGSFGLYAYGNGIGGLPIFYSDGKPRYNFYLHITTPS